MQFHSFAPSQRLYAKFGLNHFKVATYKFQSADWRISESLKTVVLSNFEVENGFYHSIQQRPLYTEQTDKGDKKTTQEHHVA